ncbi:MAG: two-component regulator propeller domain-containing protein [Acidobacteriota bacterium]|nr:two-component regulator propeller domain-containing protein [Acidobacteriota bacterium]
MLIAWLLLPAQLRAQGKILRQSLHFERYSTEEGLSVGNVACIYQDRRGFLWFGTTDGLNRFNGYQFKVFLHDPRDAASLSESSVSCILEDRDGMLWLGTIGGGLNRFDPASERFLHFRHDPNNPQSLSHDVVQSLCLDRKGRLWVGTSNGLAMLEPDASGRFTRYRHDPNDAGSLSPAILALFVDRLGDLWIGTYGGGLNRLDPDSPGRIVHYRLGGKETGRSGHNRVWAIHQDHKGILWVGTENGLLFLNPEGGQLSRFRLETGAVDDPGDRDIRAIWEDRYGYLWLGTRKDGIAMLDPERSRCETHRPDWKNPYSLSYRYVTAIYEDRGGTLWFATRQMGLNKLNRAGMRFGHYRLFGKASGYLPLDVMSIREDSTGMLWIGTPEGLLQFGRDKELVSHYRHDPDKSDSLSNDRVWTIFEDRQGPLWFGTDEGLNRLERDGATGGNGRFTSFHSTAGDPGSLSHDVVVSIMQDRSSTLWIGTAGGGLDRFDRETGKFVHARHEEGNPFSLSHDKVTCLLEDRNGLIWIGTYGGLSKLDPAQPGRFVRYRPDHTDPHSLSHRRVLTIHESRSGVLWVGADGGLNRYNQGDDSFVQYWRKDGLPNDVVYGILEDRQGFLWVSTNGGLARFDPEREIFKTYYAADGLQKNQFQFGAYFRNADGKLFFGGVNGLNAFDPDQITDNAMPPPVVITGFLLFNEPAASEDLLSPLQLPIEDGAEIRLAYEDKSFSFEFAALDYANPEKNRYGYKLEGMDERWQLTDASRRFATYTNLDPGDYVFRVKGSNRDGVWNEQGVSVRLSLLPPPWRSWWAYTLYGLAAVSLVCAYLWSHHKKLAYERSIGERLDRKVKERTRALEEKNREILDKQEQLVSQAEKLHQMDELKTRFFTNISHEIRTPLTLALGPVEDLLSDGHAQGKQRGKLEMVRRNIHRLKKLIDELLDISKLEAGRMKLRARRENATVFLKEWTHAFLSSAERKDITIVFQADCREAPLYFDPDKLEKVLGNLLTNSVKFTPEGGKILVRVDSGDPDFLSVTVKDTGPGIPADQLPFVFDRFYQAQGPATDSVSGSGVGLALAKELVLLHGGEIEIDSEPGFGCEIVVRLPKGKAHLASDAFLEPGITADEAPPRPSPADTRVYFEEALPTPERGSPWDNPEESAVVLVVEDHAEVRAYLREHLESVYRVIEADNGETGLMMALELVPDLVLSDVRMPGMDGFALCRRLKTDEKTSHIPVVLLTAKATTKSNITGLETGADDYLVKPFNARVLLMRIHNLIESRRRLRERFSREMILKPTEIAITSADQVFLQKAVATLERYMGDSRFGVYELAEELGFSRRQLQRKLKALTNKTPAVFIRQIRLERAAQLLKERAGNVAEVAYAVGFNKPQYFSTLFRETFGKNPSEYAAQWVRDSPHGGR